MISVASYVTIMFMNDDKMFSSILRSIELFAKSTQDEKKIIALKIKAYRADNKLTQEGLARKLDVTRMQIVRWEAGKNKPSKVFMKILKAEGIL